MANLASDQTEKIGNSSKHITAPASNAKPSKIPSSLPTNCCLPKHEGRIRREYLVRLREGISLSWRLEKDANAKEKFRQQVKEEQRRRTEKRQARLVPETNAGLVKYFLDTEAQEKEFEIARLRPRLNNEFVAHVEVEIGQLRFAVNRTKDMEDWLIELEAMQKVLLEGIDAYDKMQGDLVLAKERLARILQSKDKKATLLDMVEKYEINRSLLTLLDQNIASAHENEQKQAAEYMEKIRLAILKYITA